MHTIFAAVQRFCTTLRHLTGLVRELAADDQDQPEQHHQDPDDDEQLHEGESTGGPLDVPLWCHEVGRTHENEDRRRRRWQLGGDPLRKFKVYTA